MCPELKELLFLIILRKRACGEEPLAGPKVVGHTHHCTDSGQFNTTCNTNGKLLPPQFILTTD